jgi:protein-tyrosine phosphatase
MNVLFVCMGNICRSPTAEAVFRAKVTKAALDEFVKIDSAGTHNYHTGEPPDARSMAHGKVRGYDLSTLLARGIVASDFDDFDLLLVMDDLNYSTVIARAPEEHRAKVRRFMEFAPNAHVREVPDPYYGEREDFERVLDLVEAASDGLIEEARRRVQP